MFGAIMPEPFAKPLSRTVVPSIVAVAVAPFGNVSVVMIARAAGSQASADSFSAASGSAATMRSGGGGSPITPVEEMNTSLWVQPNSRAASAAVAWTTCQPARPVNTFALPELTTTARTRPAIRFCRHHTTGCPGVWDSVNTPATVLPGASSAIIMSLRPLYRIPASCAARRTPAIGSMVGKRSGARGETAAIVSDSGKAGCAAAQRHVAYRCARHKAGRAL